MICDNRADQLVATAGPELRRDSRRVANYYINDPSSCRRLALVQRRSEFAFQVVSTRMYRV